MAGSPRGALKAGVRAGVPVPPVSMQICARMAPPGPCSEAGRALSSLEREGVPGESHRSPAGATGAGTQVQKRGQHTHTSVSPGALPSLSSQEHPSQRECCTPTPWMTCVWGDRSVTAFSEGMKSCLKYL